MALSKKTPPRTKVHKTKKDSTAALETADNGLKMIADEQHLIAVDTRGITLYGPMSFATDAANIRRGGLFTGVNDFTDMIPSTILTPIPKQIPMPPINGVLKMKEDIAFFRKAVA